MRKRLERLAEKVGRELSPTTGMEQAEHNGAKWKIHFPGHAGGEYFNRLKDVEYYLLIECDGQNL